MKNIFLFIVFIFTLCRSAYAVTEINVLYGLPHLFKEAHETIARDFMLKHPDIKVNLLAPAKHYDEVATAVLRGAVAGALPDVVYNGTNLMAQFVNRGMAIPLNSFIKADPDFEKEGYIPAMLSTSQIGGVQYGMPFAISTPIAYYNIDLVRRAGGDPDNLPKTWDQVIALSEKINLLGGNTKGMYLHWSTGGTYIWQTLLTTHNAKLLTPDGKAIAFNTPGGLQALELLRDLTVRAKMPNYSREQGRQDFIAGLIGMQFSSSAELTLVTKQIGNKFTLRTAPFPTPDPQAKLVSGGATAMMFAKDPAKQRAAWAYMKFATGAQGQTTMVRFTGYNPSSKVAIDTPSLLGDYYAAAPNARVSLGQLSRAAPWVGFPGPNGIKISDMVTDKLEAVVSLKLSPKEAMQQMTAEANALIK